MPSAGTTRRAARRPAAPWWEELDREAFREFPGTRGARTAAVREPESLESLESLEAVEAPVRVPAHLDVAERPGVRPRAGSELAERADWAPRAANGRRTVAIRGHGAERGLPVARPTLRRHERPGFKPDRAALWAVVLGLFLILVAAASAHAAVAHHLAGHLIR